MQIDSSLLSTLIWWNASENVEDSETSDSSTPWWAQSSSDSSETSDVFSLSSQFSAIQDQFDALSENIQTKLGLTEVLQNAEEKAQTLGTELLQALEENGIDLGEDGVNLTMDADGLVRVFGEHENEEAIEEFFKNSAEWSEKYADFHFYTEIAHQLNQSLNPQTSINPYAQSSEDGDTIVLSLGSPDGIEVSFL